MRQTTKEKMRSSILILTSSDKLNDEHYLSAPEMLTIPPSYTKALTRQCVSTTKPALRELLGEGPRHHTAVCIHVHKYKVAAWIGVQEEQVLGKGSGRKRAGSRGKGHLSKCLGNLKALAR